MMTAKRRAMLRLLEGNEVIDVIVGEIACFGLPGWELMGRRRRGVSFAPVVRHNHRRVGVVYLDEEQALLRRARALDGAALAAIFDAYYAPIYRYLYFHTGHAQTAEDLSAQVFRRLLEKLHEGSGPERYLKAWLFRVASNLMVDESRRMQHRDHLALDEHVPALDALEDKVEQMLLLTELLAALETLTPMQRSVIILRYLMDMPNEEIVEITQTTLGGVKALQHRALAALRRHLNPAEAEDHEQS
jgi:RNA polymerase sigma-70 factor (ECF subfamily)